MTTLADIPFERINGTPASLRDFAGKVTLIVNVASKCGLTPQYAALEALYKAQRDRGFEILGFPANNFAAQEPGSNEEIAAFCSLTYGVTFPMFAKISVKGQDQHPLYAALVQRQPEAVTKPDSGFRQKLASRGITQEQPYDVLWNFEKFLLNVEGKVVGRFAPDITPDDPLLVAAVERELNTARS